jgi:hypothetical protein
MLAFGGGCISAKMISSSSHYDEVLNELRQEGQKLANQYIVELYNILREEEKMPPEDCRDKIEHDCEDLWSRATIRKYLPPESKDPKKRLAGKIGGEQKKKKAMLLLAENTEGGGARTVLAENDSDNQNNQESQTFHNQLNQQLEARQPTQELYDVSKMLADKDREIESLKQERVELQVKMARVANGILILSTDLLIKMFSESRAVEGEGRGREEVKYFYLKTEGGIVTGYETDITSSNDIKNSTIHFNQ